jgi:hypothetical protein
MSGVMNRMIGRLGIERRDLCIQHDAGAKRESDLDEA